MLSSSRTIQLLPLLLAPGRSQEIPIVIAGCSQLILHELVYRNKANKDLINECYVSVNGRQYKYLRSQHCEKTYLPQGLENNGIVIQYDPNQEITVNLEISCQDFDACGCLQQRFQLNMSAMYQ